MGCGSCGTGKPNGCKSNGGCSTGGCNRMNVHDWLMNLPFSDPESNCKIIEVSFNNGSRKEFYRNATLQYFEKGEYITVEGVSGFDVGEVSLSGELVRLQMKKKGVDEFSPEIKKVLRRSTETDLAKREENKAREKQALVRSRAMARTLNLEMKLAEVEIQADGKKATFYYTADDRVDFRELIRSYAAEFKVKVEMRQIGARQEAGKVGGIGSCGRELCCATWLTDFKSVNTTAARYQNLSINQTKLSGQCGRLKCCLNYELDTYLDALQHFPDNADIIYITRSPAYLVKKDIFKNLMWYSLPDSARHYPLTIARVKEIQKMNALGQKPDELQPVEIVSSKPKEVEPAFVDVVGQISLRSLERNTRRRKDKEQSRDLKTGEKPQAGQVNPDKPAAPKHSRTQPIQQKNSPPKQDGQPRPGQALNQQKIMAKPAKVAIIQEKQQNQPRSSNQQPGGQQSRPQQQKSSQRTPQQKSGEQYKQQQRPLQRPAQQRPPQKESETPPEAK